MIRSFACRDTERLFRIGDAGRFGAVAKVAESGIEWVSV